VFDTHSPADRAATLTIESGSPAATLVDFFPLMRHIPTWVPVISNFKRKALQARDAVENMFHQPYERVKQDIVSLAAFSLSLSDEKAPEIRKSTPIVRIDPHTRTLIARGPSLPRRRM